jgi:hypothetical protein
MYPKFWNVREKMLKILYFSNCGQNYFENFQKNLHFPKIMSVPKTENLKN